MYRLLRISICTGALLSGLILFAQQPATIDNEPAVRFEQSPGYYHYLAFCRTPKAASTQMPKTGLPIDQIEFGLGWYVKASVSRGTGAASPESFNFSAAAIAAAISSCTANTSVSSRS